ncbi:MAG: alpha/beta hydrolase [Nocardia sp.]|nr:alpha/beta hydrolase [Nocardia sp.]
MTSDPGAPQPVLAVVDGIEVSGLLAPAPDPRGVLLALHGGGATSVYYDCPGHPELSLLRLAAANGFTVLALDRPGYGATVPYADRLWEPQSRVDLIYRAAEQVLAGRSRGAGTVLIAHSAGCELALRMAADERGRDLLGVEVAGTGRLPTPEAQQAVWGRPAGTRPRGLYDLLWKPVELYPPDMVGGGPVRAEGHRLEAATVNDWSEVEFPDLAGRIRIPVRFTLADHERVWRSDEEAFAQVAVAFTAAPRVVLNRQPGSGHNLSVGRSARAYHLGVLAFAEECLIAAEQVFDCPATQFDGAALDSAREARPL